MLDKCSQLCLANLNLTTSIPNITMETSQPGQSEQPSHRSLKDLRRDGVRVLFSPAAKRLFWPLDGVFPTAISVMKTPRSADDLEPFFRPDTGGDGGGTWHEISQLPLTEPKVSSLEASVYDLEQWEYDWIEWHKDHDAPAFDQEFVAYGDLDDDVRPYADEAKEGGSWEEEEDTEFLVKCCGDDRPLRKRGLKLVVTPSAGSDSFVTMQDYVSGMFNLPQGLAGLSNDNFSCSSLAYGPARGDFASEDYCTSSAISCVAVNQVDGGRGPGTQDRRKGGLGSGPWTCPCCGSPASVRKVFTCKKKQVTWCTTPLCSLSLV